MTFLIWIIARRENKICLLNAVLRLKFLWFIYLKQNKILLILCKFLIKIPTIITPSKYQLDCHKNSMELCAVEINAMTFKKAFFFNPLWHFLYFLYFSGTKTTFVNFHNAHMNFIPFLCVCIFPFITWVKVYLQKYAVGS